MAWRSRTASTSSSDPVRSRRPGPLAKDAIPTLEKLTEHADPQIVERAKAALRQVRGDLIRVSVDPLGLSEAQDRRPASPVLGHGHSNIVHREKASVVVSRGNGIGLQSTLWSGRNGELIVRCYSWGPSAKAPGLPKETRARADALGIKIEIDHYDSREDEEAV